ncbi:MAG: hypothetical protein H6704_08425 [Myxococcales bacterium]|nr:hypothetical protein [Myxococcales bacterium]
MLPPRTSSAWLGPVAFGLTYAILFALAAPWPGGEWASVVGFVLAFGALAAVVVFAGDGAARARLARDSAIVALVGGAAAVALGVVGGLPPAVGGLVAGLGLLVGGTWLGAALGRGVQDAAHLWPLVLVAMGADAWSVFAPEGLTRQVVVEGETPLVARLVVLSLPVPGVGVEPVLGVGDVVFTALLLGAARGLDLPMRRAIGGLLVGYALCLVALVVLALPLPALPFLGLGFAVALGRHAATRARDVALALGFVGLLFGLRWLAA